MDTLFNVKNHSHVVKFIAYATTSKITIQQIGDERKPIYFADTFLDSQMYTTPSIDQA